MVASNTLPDDGYWINATASLQDAQFESANNEFLCSGHHWVSPIRAAIALNVRPSRRILRRDDWAAIRDSCAQTGA
jgi:hypothetical protein